VKKLFYEMGWLKGLFQPSLNVQFMFLKYDLTVKNGSSQVYWSKNIFHQILVTFEISSLAASVWVRGWGNVNSSKARSRKPPVIAADTDFC
jgi:hypothetical protein